jgi:hypothetical protein
MKLREDRSYGTVYGHSRVAYEQDGRQFGHDKILIEGSVVDPPPITDPMRPQDLGRSTKMKPS